MKRFIITDSKGDQIAPGSDGLDEALQQAQRVSRLVRHFSNPPPEVCIVDTTGTLLTINIP